MALCNLITVPPFSLAAIISQGVAQTWMFLVSAVAFGTIELIERRTKNNPLHPGRQIQLSTLLESMPEAIFVIDPDGRVVECNQAAERLTGVSKEQLKALASDDVARYVADPHGLPERNSEFALNKALRGETVHQERRKISAAGTSTLEALISATPIREQDGKIVGALIVVRDITELSEMQRHLEETERQSAIGTMAASLTHDFNNVLDTISKAATVLEVAPERTATDRAAVLRMIQNAVKRGSEIVGNVRQFLTGNMATSDLIDMNTILEEAIELTRPMWQGAPISLVREFQPVPRVHANAAEMRRVFTNLILNAVEAMRNGGTLIVGCRCEQGKVRSFVEDSGEGIPPEKYDKIFVPYFTTKQKGTGLGLSSSLRAVRAQRGDITFSSRVGEGSRFMVELPANDAGKQAA